VARCLIIGCGCRGLSLARELRAKGHAVRATTRDRDRLQEIEAAGVEAVHGDPDRIATIAPAFDHVSVAYVLLGSATGAPDALRALHGTRLQMLLLRMLDTTVRGIAYEAAGAVEPSVLEAGGRIVAEVCLDSRIPHVLLDQDPADHVAWLAAAAGALETLLGAPAADAPT
jgi:saccharopine dehydrogenase-like NADP-dependent oxidoreductase